MPRLSDTPRESKRGAALAAPFSWSSESGVMEGSKPAEFEVDDRDAISAPEAFGASFDAAPSSDGARARRGARGRSGDRVPPDARHVRDRSDGPHDARRRAGARHDGERLHVRLAAAAARPHLDRPAREDGRDAARGDALRGQRARGEADRPLRPLRRTCRRRPARGDVRDRPRDAARRGRARAPRRPRRPLVLGRRPLARSSARSSSRATGRAGRSSSTAAATSGSSRIRASSRSSRASSSTRSSRSARSASTPTASRSCRWARRGASSCSSSKVRRASSGPAAR